MLKEELKNASINLEKVQEEMNLVQGRKFEISKHLLTVVESRDAPFVAYISQIMDRKLKPIMETLNNIQNFLRSGASAK